MRPKLGVDQLFVLEALPVHFATGLPQRILVPVKGLLATAASDGPADIRYQRVEPQIARHEVLVAPRQQLDAYPPMEGDKPLVRAQAPPLPLEQFLRERWFWIVCGIALLFVIRTHWTTREKHARYFRDVV